MSKKRFYLDENGINDREYEFSILGEDELVDIINELNDENAKLKIFLKAVNEELSLANRDNDTLEEENKQLKQFKEDVFNKIDMNLRMLRTARDNEFNEENGDPSLYAGAIYLFETLKKELSE